MHSPDRRKFLLDFTVTWGTLSLAGCGGGQQVIADVAATQVATRGGSASDSVTPTVAPQDPAASTADAPAASLPGVASDPKWMIGKPANAWVAVPGTVHAGSAAAPTDNPSDPYAASNRRLAYSGMAMRNGEIILAACGGHNDYSGNEVTSIDLSNDAPAWVLRKAASKVPTPNVPYYPDGTPVSRHAYWASIWCPQRNRVMLHYSRACYDNATSFPNSNGFDLDTNTWDPAGTWSDGYSAGCADANGDCFAMGVGYFSLAKWTPATDTWTTVARYDAAINVNPVCYDPARAHLFALAWGDGQGNAIGGSMSLSAFKISGSTKTAITFNPSTALVQFQQDGPAYCGMDYDPINDQYLFYEGAAGRTSRIYVVKPNNGSVWDMQVLSLNNDSVIPVPAEGAGVFNRFRYVPALRGFVLMSSGTSEVLFMRTG